MPSLSFSCGRICWGNTEYYIPTACDKCNPLPSSNIRSLIWIYNKARIAIILLQQHKQFFMWMRIRPSVFPWIQEDTVKTKNFIHLCLHFLKGVWWCSCHIWSWKEDPQNTSTPNQWLGRWGKVSRVLRLSGCRRWWLFSISTEGKLEENYPIVLGVFKPERVYEGVRTNWKRRSQGFSMDGAGRTKFSGGSSYMLDFLSEQGKGLDLFLGTPAASYYGFSEILFCN